MEGTNLHYCAVHSKLFCTYMSYSFRNLLLYFHFLHTSGMGGDFNALLEFADGEDGEEDNEKLPSNLFDDLDADEEER